MRSRSLLIAICCCAAIACAPRTIEADDEPRPVSHLIFIDDDGLHFPYGNIIVYPQDEILFVNRSSVEQTVNICKKAVLDTEQDRLTIKKGHRDFVRVGADAKKDSTTIITIDSCDKDSDPKVKVGNWP